MKFLVLALVFLSAFISFAGKTPAYAEFDKAGNYVCNPIAPTRETNIYMDTVSKINYKMELYLKTNPLATPQEQHAVILQDQKTWDLYFKSKACISSIGVNPNDIASLDTSVQQAIAIPEFPFVIPILLIGIISSIIFYRMKKISNY